MSKLIKTRSDLLNFVLETAYVSEVFARDLQTPPVVKEDLRPRIRMLNED